MSGNQLVITKEQHTKILAFGMIIGALVGLGAAYLLLQQADREEGVKLTPGEGVKLGISVFNFFRQVTQLGG